MTHTAATEQASGEHALREFGLKDAVATVETMTADVVIGIAPLAKRYEGRDAVLAFYRDEFIPCIDAMTVEVRNRTVSTEAIVDEMRVSLRFDGPMPWSLPEIAPSGKTVIFDRCLVARIRENLVA
jgi:hypothetical protein